MTEIREELLKEERERREKYLLAVDKTKFSRDKAVKRVQQYIINMLLEHKAPPLISAQYFNWKIDQRIMFCFGEKDADFPPPPPLYEPPYSTTYAKAYFAANPTEEEKAEEVDDAAKDKGKGKEKETQGADSGRYYGFARASTQVVDPADGTLGDVVGVPAWSLTGEPPLLAPLEDKVRLYQDLIGQTMPYQEGCGPFQVECPFSALGKDYEICFGGPEESLAQLLGEAAFFMGGMHGVMLFAKFRDLPNGDRRVSLFLDWHKITDTKSPAWQRVLYKAWCALLSLFHNQLRGMRVGLMDHLRDYYGGSMREHLMLYSRIGAAVQQLERSADARPRMGGDEEEMEALLAKLDRFAKKKGSEDVARHVKAKPNIADKIRELARLRDDPKGLPDLGDDPEARLTMIQPTAERILTEQIRWLLQDPDVPLGLVGRLEQCIACLDDPNAPWGKLLPLDVAHRIVLAGVWEYKRVHGSEEGFQWVDRTITLLESFKI
ncbi:hypothetical protein FHL15_004886 [Xylaria flabelliformis]|uniref:Uncharacterized protein n=1 Tax=Xylaria flabelliformis TaxID=2512241 RepID=A0A553I1P5_9PEZI|nr:hypothetical protein FHL15_004886 [Xylaria flabelliformis]